MRKTLLRWIKIIIIVYVLAGIALYFLQEKLLFHPRSLPAGYVFNFPEPFREINLAVTNEKNLNIIQFTVPDSICRGVVLYFHGNKRNVERYAPYAPNFTRQHYEVWMIDYPGYGKSTGKRTEQIMYDDALEMYKMASARFSPDSIIIYGKSLGTGIASWLSAYRDCRQLILECPYYSMEALMRHYAFMYPVSWMTHFNFPTYEYVERTKAPVSIFHGESDGLIPFNQARRLKKIKPGIELIPIEKGSHNDLNDFPLYHQKLDSLLSQ